MSTLDAKFNLKKDQNGWLEASTGELVSEATGAFYWTLELDCQLIPHSARQKHALHEMHFSTLIRSKHILLVL
jgi:hypothetical protein